MARMAMARRCFLQTDTKGHGVRAIAQGAHCDGCEPSPAPARVGAPRRQIIQEAGESQRA